MLKYEELYKRIGINKIHYFLNPRLINSEEFVFPVNSMLFWYKISDVIVTINTGGYLGNLKQPLVKPVFEYKLEEPLGSFRQLNNTENKIISLNKKTAKSFKFIKSKQKNINLSNNKVFIFNYGSLGFNYKYGSHPENLYYKWYNSFNTMVNNVKNTFSGNNRHKFIHLDMPDGMPELPVIKKYLKVNNRTMLNEFYNYKRLNALELFRFVDTENTLSVLKSIPVEEYYNIDLILTHNTGVVLLNLGILYSIVKEHNNKGKLATYSSATVIKLLYVFFNNIITNTPKSITYYDKDSDIETTATISLDKLTKISDIKTEADNNVDIDVKISEISPDSDKEKYEDDIEKEEKESYIDSLETTEVEDLITTDINEINKLLEPVDKIKKELEVLKDNRILSTQQYKKSLETIEKRYTSKSPYPDDNSKLKDVLKYDDTDIHISEDEIKLPDSVTLLDKSMNKDIITVLNKKYINKTYKKDILNVFESIQTAGYIIEDHEVSVDENITGGMENHVLHVKNIDGAKSTINIKLPILKEDGTFMLSGSKYLLRKQRTDLPIRKISNTEVSLASYYGKLFISKSTFKKDDPGYWFQKQLSKKYETDDKLKDLVLLPVENVDAELPKDYGIISRYTKSFRYGNRVFYFEYETRNTLLKDKDLLNTIEDNNVVLVGMKGNIPIVMNMKNELFEYVNKKFISIPDIYDLLDIDRHTAPMEYINIRIMKKQVPVGVILSYYLGLFNLLKLLKSKYRLEDSSRTHIDASKEFKIVFKDKVLVIEKDHDKNDLILAGISSINKITKTNNISVMNKRSSMNTIFNQLELPLLYANEIKLLEDSFVDPITAEVLKLYKEPQTLKGLLIRSSELLVDDNYKHPNDVTGMIIKGYERIPGMLYKELMTAIRLSNNRSYFAKSKLNIDPYIVIKDISSDSTTVIQDDLNPVANLKQYEDLSVLGIGGRSKETMVKKTRLYHESAIGLISESSKDSGDVGITAYMSASPKIKNVRGVIDKFDIKKDGWSSVLSTSALLTPFSTQDDMKRVAFINGQNSHVIPMNNMRAPYVRTGYESILPYRVIDKYCINAKEEGKVLSVTDNNVKIQYKSGNKSYKLYEWTTKEESGSCYTHKVVTNLKKNDKVNIGDNITYDMLFFETDVFNRKRVLYKAGTMVTTVLMEDTQTYEDSAAISNKLNSKLGTVITKVKSIVVDVTDNIIDIVNVKDKVDYDTGLFTIVDKLSGDISKLDKKSKDIIKSLNSKTPKAKVKGVISAIEIRYNSEISEMSGSLKKLVSMTDEYMLDKYGYTGKVNSSYSIEGKPLLSGSLEIKIYIKANEGMGIGDKAIVASQLKFTVGEVFDYKMSAEDGTDIELVFSNRSVAARIVNSADLVGTTSMVLEKLKDKAVKMYFGE